MFIILPRLLFVLLEYFQHLFPRSPKMTRRSLEDFQKMPRCVELDTLRHATRYVGKAQTVYFEWDYSS